MAKLYTQIFFRQGSVNHGMYKKHPISKNISLVFWPFLGIILPRNADSVSVLRPLGATKDESRIEYKKQMTDGGRRRTDANQKFTP